MKLDTILGSIPLEVGDFEFALVPFSTSRVLAWNRATVRDHPKDLTESQKIDILSDVQREQAKIIAAHMSDCLKKGDPKKVTAKWVEDTLPNTTLMELAVFFVKAIRPEWADSQD